MNSDPPRLLEQLDPPRRREGFWVVGIGVFVAIVVGALLLKSGGSEPSQTATLASAVVPAKVAPPKDESAATTPPVAIPNEAPPPATHAPRRSAHRVAAKVEPPAIEVGASASAKPAKVEPKDEPLPDFPVPTQH
ncbi:MAG TPA: hypothetical protein VIF62_36185 [Labilithrix sp.]